MTKKKEPPIRETIVDTSRQFTDEQVWELRRRVRSGEKMRQLAAEFGVSGPCVASAVKGTGTYKDV